MLKKLLSIAAVVGIVSWASVALATFRVVQTPTYHLYSGESGTATSMRITPYPVDLDQVKLTMTDFGDTPTVTVDPKLSSVEEIESFTGITDNGDNTATLTGLTRDLTSKYPYTTAGTGKTHGSGAVVVFGNNPQIYGRLAAPENIQTWVAQQIFSIPPIFTSAGTSTSQAASIAYVNSVAVQGAATSTASASGIGLLATGAQAAAGTYKLDTPRFLSTSISTSSPDNQHPNMVVITGSTGVFSPNAIATSSADAPNGYLMTASTTINGPFQTLSTAPTTTLMAALSKATTTSNGFDIYGNVVVPMTSGEALAVTTPMPVYLATSTGKVLRSAANTAVAKNFIGFAVSSSTNSTNVYVQVQGVVNGFTGLTAGSEYYVQDTAGTIGTSLGTAEIYVGRAISTTQILIDQTRQDQYLGVATGGTGAISVPLYTRKIIVTYVGFYWPGGGTTDSPISGTSVLEANGATDGRIDGCDIGTGQCGAIDTVTASWNKTTSVVTTSATAGSSGGSITSYFYR